MWRPLAPLLTGAFLLFFNDQGRELGVSLMIDDDGTFRFDKPYFAHLAMCRSDDHGPVRAQPPLGWVLSQATQTGLDSLVSRCGNREQLEQLKAALGGQPQQQAVGASAAN
jgi:hypothetical protein